MSPNATLAPTQYLSFVLAGEEYAVEILRVKEIIEYESLTRVPAMPAAVRGVINLRGRVVPVVDLALRFGLGASPLTRRSCIVMVELAAQASSTSDSSLVVGIICDEVSEVLDLAADQVQPPPAFGTAVGAEYLQGLAEAGKKFVLLMNIERALDTSTFAPDAATLAAA
ncbi:MAG: chemotaxis protein CheW [Gemmatimonadetes bacterium]|nr:chemotaxis protein CheW [Gemmatimonadota bacterium]